MLEKRIFELTVTEFMQLLESSKQTVQVVPAVKQDAVMLYSIKELASFLNCSVPTAQKIKNGGRIPFAQTGRKCIFNGTEILAAMEVNRKGSKK